MARKNKSSKDFNEHNTDTTTFTNPRVDNFKDSSSLQKKINCAELMFQQQQHASSQITQQINQQYQSDSELMELKQNLNLEKNKPNSFLLKSYSFNEKTNNAKRPQNLNVQKQLEEFNKYHKLMFDESSSVLKNDSKMNLSNKKKENQTEKYVMLEKPKKPPKLKKIKKSKSCYDSTEDLQEFQEILRKPKTNVENEQQWTEGQRPHSMPTTTTTTTTTSTITAQGNNHKSIIKSKTMDDIEVSHCKRDSFIRHSWQSICRSFSSSKKHQNNHLNSNSKISTSSNSTSSDNWKKSKANDNTATEGSNNLIAKEEKKRDGKRHFRSLSSPCNIVLTVNNVQALKEPQQQQQQKQHKEPEQHCVEFNASKSTPACPYAMDSLAVLKEEDEKDSNTCANIVNSSSGSNNNNKYNTSCVIMEQRSTSSVSTLAQLPTSPMAPLQTHTECQSVQCLNISDKDYKSLSSTNTIGTTTSSSSPPQKIKKTLQHQLSIPESLHSTPIGCTTSGENSSARTIAYSETPSTPQQTFNSSGSFRSISPLRRSTSSNSSSTAKHEQATASATAVAATTATTSNAFTSTTPPEKEKKRKEVSSSRVKKFHRHFSQVSKDEKLINYFSCALVSDILLQGYLYITDKHFAFYSNVFGYVTKVVIPTSSVTKITKEKTAKIIPNAVGVATADERHVFGSFLSREAAFRLMCSVCPPVGVAEILPKDPPGEYSIEDDSSCSISGNESPAQITDLQTSNTNVNLLSTDTSQTLIRRSVGSSNLSLAEISADKIRHSDNFTNAKLATNVTSCRTSAPAAINGHFVNGAGVQLELQPATKPALKGGDKFTLIAGCASNNTSASSTPTPSTSSLPTIIATLPNSKVNHIFNILRSVSKKLMVHIKFPTEIHVVYLGVILTLILALFSLFLLYRILDIEAKTNVYRSPTEFNWHSGNDDEIFSEALRFQKQLQLKSTEEAQNILKTNLEQIAKVRRSLETLAMLIHDRSSSFVSAKTDDSD